MTGKKEKTIMFMNHLIRALMVMNDGTRCTRLESIYC